MRTIYTPGDTVTVAVGAASVQSAIIFTGPQYERGGNGVRFDPTVDCWVRIGVNPTATAAAPSMRFVAGAVDYFEVPPGHRVAVIQASTGGSLHLTPLISQSNF